MLPRLRNGLLVSLLVASVLGSALAGIWAKHQARRLFVDLETLVAERDQLEMDWGRLQIEQSTWANHSRVEQLAREQMSMRTPRGADVRLVVQ
jgi:cell division protein FtsL